MTEFINRFKIPTILGLGIIFLGIVIGVYLVLREQVFLSQAAPNLTPKDVTFTNITEASAVISWQTPSEAASFITFGQGNPREQTVLDDRDTDSPKPHLTHYVTLKNLQPKTIYQFKIISGKFISDIFKFETAAPLANQTGFTPVIGSVLDEDTPLQDGIVYLLIQDAATQSTLIKTGGNFLIPLSQIRKMDLSDTFSLTEETIAKLTIESGTGSSSVLFKLKTNSTPLLPIKIGQNIDLTTSTETPQSPSASSLTKYDLNGDGKINAADNAIILLNFGKNPNDKKADINEDGTVDQKDLGLMSQKLEELSTQ